MAKDADRLFAMGFRSDGGEPGVAKAFEDGVWLRLDRVGEGWRCSCATEARKGGCVSRVASWRAGSPMDAVLSCLSLAKGVIAKKRERYEAEAERLRAMEDAITAMKEKADGRKNN